MKSATLDSKTIRPGSSSYSFYRSGVSAQPQPKAKKKKKTGRRLVLSTFLIFMIAAGVSYALKPSTVNPSNTSSNTAKTTSTKSAPSTTAAATTPTVNHCSSNSLPQLILVSISARHLWACDGPNVAYDSAVVTGDTQYADTLTPLGTYHIYAKATDRTLTGSDENGSWSDFVNYWMPFLDNQYGAYGLHDATWRDPSAFGNIDPNSSTASNGCVELPLATAKWLYNWDSVGTTVTIES
jgi:lipoprotein-anchoring transpeptidase ErfK/SrfK